MTEARNIRVGLPHLAVGGLSENWLFKELGDLHWSLLEAHYGIDVTELRDSRGERLLPAFVRIRIAGEAPLSAYAEGDRLTLAGELTAMDEQTFVSDLHCSGPAPVTARLMTVFATRRSGNALVLGVPAATGPATAEPSREQLDFNQEFRSAREAEGTGHLGATYRLNPYHDLNGAGLLYFASYPHINDYGERAYFHGPGRAQAGLAPGQDWSVATSTVSRDVIYLGNCGPEEDVRYRLDAFSREGDGRVRLVSTLLRDSDATPLARITTIKEIVDHSPATTEPAHAGPRLGIDELERRLLPLVTSTLEVHGAGLDRDTDLRRHGLDSYSLTTLAAEASTELGTEVDPSGLFQARSVADLARMIAGEPGPAEPAGARTRPAEPADAIAVVGMAGRFPGADSVDELWDLLAEGREAVDTVPADRWVSEAAPGAPGRAGLLRDVRRFDHAFFRISPREAELMDPQQRLFLEVAWETFEEAGYDVSRLEGSRTGVFVGVCHNDYAALVRQHGSGTEPHLSVANSFSVIPNRVSFALGLRGSSVAVDTLCSSSLVAVAQAVRELRAGECEQALVGGVNVLCDPRQHRTYAEAGVLSPDGRCRTFDASANGYVRGEGVCALLLKPLRQARADGDHVHGVIRAAAVNHGGQSQSLTVPNADAQADLLVHAYQEADLDPATVGYLEAHGTGTVLGDPIEVSGITRAFQRLGRAAEPACVLGSLKTNIGHLESAAGLAGMIKVLLAMRHGTLPGTAHFTELNPKIRIESTPLRVRSDSATWARYPAPDGTELPRRAGVSSFGMGGTNAHVVLEEGAPRPAPAAGADPGPWLVPLSARTAEELAELAGNLLRFLDRPDPPALPAIAGTLRVGRAAMARRAALLVHTLDELRAGLREVHQGRPVAPEGAGELAELARDWCAGGDIDWAARYPDPPHRVSLPTYPFRARRHWIVPERQPAPETFLTREWVAGEQAPARRRGTFLVLVNDTSAAVAGRLPELDGLGELRPVLVRSLADLPGEDEPIDGVIDLADLWADPGQEDREFRWEVLRRTVATRRTAPLVLLHLTSGLRSFRTERPSLAGAELAGLYRVLPAESPRSAARTIDLDFGPDRADLLGAVLAAELDPADRETEICYRSGTRFRPRLVPTEPTRPVLPGGLAGLADGAVVITGGTGGIGLRLAARLAERGVRHLVLIGNSTLPARSRWRAVAADEATEPGLRDKLRALVALLDRGVTLEVRTHGLGNPATVKALITKVHKRAGSISAVFHCAGTMGEARAFPHKRVEDAREVLAPKVAGLHTLWAALQGKRSGPVVLFSSISSAVPSLGATHADYAAANAFLDFFAEAHDDPGGVAVRSLEWPLWTGVGLGRNLRSGGPALGIPDLDPADALDLLDTALRDGTPPVALPCRVAP
ncbi:SDR family NAD(P)-dependent oxidoreductase, partial [Amycolatopsis cihanbeyliensis]